MKTILFILSGLFILLTSCNNSTTQGQKNYMESQPSFFELRNGNWLTNKWIRKPENLLTIHETFKKFGYWNLISENLLSDNPLLIQGIYINRKGGHLLDSLEFTYNQKVIVEKYYREFWQRRKAEKNDSIVYLIIKEINFSLNYYSDSRELTISSKPNLVNDTLLNLLKIEYRRDSLTKQIALQDFETLKKIGFHQSAYNLLYEKYEYQNVDWNRDSLEKSLSKSNQFIYPWFQDDTN